MRIPPFYLHITEIISNFAHHKLEYNNLSKISNNEKRSRDF